MAGCILGVVWVKVSITGLVLHPYPGDADGTKFNDDGNLQLYNPYISIICPPVFDHDVIRLATQDAVEGQKSSDLCYYNWKSKSAEFSDGAGFRVYANLFLIEMIGTFILVSVILKIKEHTC